MNDLFRETLKATVLGDADTANELNRRMSDDDLNAYNTFVTAMFCKAAEHWFETERSQDAISRFVDGMRDDYRNLDASLNPAVIEGLIRAVFGDGTLLVDVGPLEQFRHKLLAIRKIVDQSDHFQQHLDQYLADAETLAREWDSEEY